MANGWTAERRVKQAEAIRRSRPWERSTGLKADDGQAASQNSRVHGLRSAEWPEEERHVNQLLREWRERLKRV